MAFSNLKSIYEGIMGKKLNPPKKVMCNFETALRNAIINIFAKKKEDVEGCFFHYVKALWFNGRKLGVKKVKDLKLVIFLLKNILYLILFKFTIYNLPSFILIF